MWTIWNHMVQYEDLRLGWDTMSSTSSGLFCSMAAAILNVTPSRLILFREISRPPKQKRKRLSASFICFFLHKRGKMVRILPGLILPSLSAGPSGTMDAMKTPRSNFPVLSSPTITKPLQKQWYIKVLEQVYCKCFMLVYKRCSFLLTEAKFGILL